MKQRPLLAWLWPSPPPGPVDDNAVQERWLRVGHRGPLRLALLAASTILLVAAMGTMIFTVTLSASRADDFAGAVVFSIIAIALARAWSLGTYVNDRGIKIVRMTRTISSAWHDVTIVLENSTVYLCANAKKWATHVSRRNPDFLFREEAFDIARDQLTNWWNSR